jgi:hypothetical protein
VDLVSQLGAGVVEGQDPQEVYVKGSEVARDLLVDRSSTAAMLPIAGSVHDKMVPAISAAQTEMADFLVYFCSR